MLFLAVWIFWLFGQTVSVVKFFLVSDPSFGDCRLANTLKPVSGLCFFSVGRQAIVIVCRNSRSMELKMLALFIF